MFQATDSDISKACQETVHHRWGISPQELKGVRDALHLISLVWLAEV